MLIALALQLRVSQLNVDRFGSALTCITHMTAISTHNASVHIVALAELAGSCLLCCSNMFPNSAAVFTIQVIS